MTSSSSSSPEIQSADSQDRFSYKLATHEEVLDDLSSRFILNLPDDELSSLERICFQVEQAHWFYEDFIREENPKFPSLPLKKFSEMLFQACPLLQQWSHDHESAYTNFMQYKTRVPVCGAIMLNDTWEKCVLVKGWKASSGWGFPKGKINQVEPPANCAIREVLEETGYNLTGQINPEHVIETSIREQKISLFVVPGVPEDYPFKTKTRKEISKIEWFRLADLPTWKRNKTSAGRFYLISPFIGPLKSFINANKPRSRKILKAKKAQPYVSRSIPIYSTAKGLVHESSSHSPSADDGGPHTLTPASPLQISNEGSSVTTVDPHFAKLLSALANSASKHDTQPLNVVSTSNPPIIKEPKDIEPNISAPVTLPRETSSVAVKSSITETATPGLFPRPFEPRFSIGVSVDPSNSSTAAAIVDTAQLTLSPRPLKSPEGFSPTSLTTRSGNLSKQHIALLDAVSKESAKLQEAYKTAVANGVPINDSFLCPIIATTALPSSLTPRSHANTPKCLASIYSAPRPFITSQTMNSSSFISSQCSGLPSVAGCQDASSDPIHLQERPRTILAHHNDPSITNIPGSVSMNQSQLLSLMNGSPPTNPSIHYAGCPLPPTSRPTLLAPYRISNPEPQISPLAPQSASTVPIRSLASVPMMTSHMPIQALPAASNTLLSILNSGKNTSSFSDFPPYPRNPIARD